MRFLRMGMWVLGSVAALLLPLLFTSVASADLNFCPSGAGIGQCANARGVAVDQVAGRLYVADGGNNRIDVFKSNGEFLMAFGWGVADGSSKFQKCTTICGKGIAGSGPGQFENPSGIAVNNVAGPDQGEIYVTDNSFRVQRFNVALEVLGQFGIAGKGKCQIARTGDPVAVGPGGVVYLGDSYKVGLSESEGFASRIQKFDASGGCLEEVPLPGVHRPIKTMAVDSGGNIFLVGESEGTGIRKFHSDGSEYGAPYPLGSEVEVRALAIDSEDNLLSAEREPPFRVIAEYDSVGDTLRRFGYDTLHQGVAGIAPFHDVFGDVFLSEEGVEMRYLSFPAPGPIAVPSTAEAKPIGNTNAVLNVQVNPEGKATSYHFDFVTQENFEQSEFATAKSSAVTLLGAEDFKLHLAQAQIGCASPPDSACLQPETIYRFRVIAENGAGKGEAEGEFETRPPLEIGPTYATEVGTDAGVIHAGVNPLGIPAMGFFQYVSDTNFNESGFSEAIKVPSEGQIEFGSGEATIIRAATLGSLTPGTTYHYRLVADDALIEPVAGPERTFTTFRPLAPGEAGPCANEAVRLGTGAFLADCRGYEMVSPLDKANADIRAPEEPSTGQPAALNQSSVTGQRLTYSTIRAFGNPASAPYAAQYIAARDSQTGWHNHAIVPPRSAPVLTPGKQIDTEFKAFTADLCSAWFRTTAEPQLTPDAVARFPNLYRRSDEECGGGGGFEALTTIQPVHETTAAPYPGQFYTSLELQGISGNGNEAIYAVLENLTEDAPAQSLSCITQLETVPSSVGEECSYRLYAYSAADHSLNYVCVLPNGVPTGKACSAGTAVENIGLSRSNWLQNAISADGSRVFWSTSEGNGLGPGKIYVRENPVAEPSEGAECEAAKACTIAVSAGGEKLSGTNESRYWGAARDGSVAIFTSGGDLYRFNVDEEKTQLIAHKVSGVMGLSDDASYVYFTSSEDLGGGATAGRPNLYLHHEGVSKFVATLSDKDVPSKNNFSLVATEPRKRVSRVSPDGLHAAFMSQASLTNYDNADAVTGEADAEVYLYDAAAGGGEGKMICASCNPTGARPVGRELFEGPVKQAEYRAAAQVPLFENSLYAARSLADDGSRLYFPSTDALSPRDTNGQQDVYQWEEPGSGSCQKQSLTFSPRNSGCVTLVSSGKSLRDSELVDASPSGDDVFISTLSSLVTQDYGLVDIYDARVDGGFPPPPPPPPGCEGEACQGPLALPNDPTPASSTFEGAGNVGVAKRCPKGKVRRKGRCLVREHKSVKKHKQAQRHGRAGR
jgi:hypothetical protein